ncbi:hypothetical protein LBMAG42_07920 [Deltaproteobacteria bacterium]|nr:hypothetical protein LBMAG42_07920 [Deltaproteobacteria bacterium]
MNPRTLLVGTLALVSVFACTGGNAPTPVSQPEAVADPAAPPAPAPAPEAAVEEFGYEDPINFLHLTGSATACKVEFAVLERGAVTVKHLVAELPFGCADVMAEVDVTGQSLAFVDVKTSHPVVLVQNGAGSLITLPEGARAEGAVFDGPSLVVLSEPDVALREEQGEESTIYRTTVDGKEYEVDSPQGFVQTCATHRAPAWARDSFELLALGEGSGPPFCRNFGAAVQTLAHGRTLTEGDRGGFGTFYEPVDPAAEPSGTIMALASEPPPARRWIWGSPVQDLEGQTPTGPLTVFVSGAAGWSSAVVPDSTSPAISPPFVCGNKGMILSMSDKDAASHARVIWSSEFCPIPWPSDLKTPPVWKGVAPVAAPSPSEGLK